MSKLTDKELHYLNCMGLVGFTRTPRIYVEKKRKHANSLTSVQPALYR